MNRVPRFFHEGDLSIGGSAQITGGALHHLAHVLRLQAGAGVCLFNGDGRNYFGTVQSITRQQASVTIEEAHSGPRPSALQPVLAIGISKARHFDLALQKGTELGVACVVPLAAGRSPGHATRESSRQREHWRGVMISACEQCARTDLPDLQPTSSVENFAGDPLYAGHTRLLLDPAGNPLPKDRPDTRPVLLCCGPEGGFSESEKQLLTDSGFLRISCGPRILRTETTPLAMLAIVQYLWGDLS